MSTPIRQALAAPRRGVVGFFRGLSLPFRGAKLVYVENPDLVRFWLVPILVTLVVLVLSIWAVFHYDDTLIGMVWSDPGSSAEGFQAWLADAARGVLWFLLDALLLTLAVLVTLLLSAIVAAPFNARLAEVLDERLTGTEPPPFALGRVLLDVLRTVVIEIVFFVVNTLLFFAGLAFPIAGPALFVVGLAAWALYFAVAYVDAPQAARGKTLGDRLRFVIEHPMAMLGFGTGVGLFLIVPLVNLLFMPAAVAGGVMLCAEAEGHSPPPNPP